MVDDLFIGASVGIQPSAGAIGWTFPDNAIDISARLTQSGSWVDVDLGANNDVPTGTTGIIVRTKTDGADGDNGIVAFLPKGNTLEGGADDYAASATLTGWGYHTYNFVKLDDNRTFRGYFAAANTLTMHVIGYTNEPAAQFPTAPTTKNPSEQATGSFPYTGVTYGDIDCSAIATGPGAVFYELIVAFVTGSFRPKTGDGSTFDKPSNPKPLAGLPLAMMPIDGSELGQCWTQVGSNPKFRTWGYTTKFTAIAPVDVTPIATGWQDCDASLPVGAKGALIYIWTNDTTTYHAVGARKKVVSGPDTLTYLLEQDFGETSFVQYGVVGVDANGIFQFNYANLTNQSLYVLGYFT